MQYYSKRFSKFYETSSSDDSHRQSICFLRECISNDSVIPKHVLDFVEFMYEALNLKTVEAIIKHLYAIFPENDTISELLTIKIDSRGKHRWPLLFALISDNIRDIAIRLINEDYEELLSVHLKLINEQPSIFCGQAVLKTITTRNNVWNSLALNDKNTHLEPFFANYPNFTSIFARLSNKKQPKISDVLLVTEIILKHFNQLQDFNKIDTIFQATVQSDIRQALNAFPSLRDKRSDLASKIFQLKKSFSDNSTDERTRSNQIDNFCTILQQLVILNDDQLKAVQSSIRSAWSLLCVVSKNDTRLSDVIDRALHLLYALDNKNEFALVRDAYKQFCSTPSWTAMQRLTNIIHSGYEINNLIEKLNTSIDEEETASNAFRICRYLSTSNEQVLFDKIEIKTQELSSTKLSNIELLKQIEESASNLIKNKAQLFLQSIRTFELILSKNAHDDQSLSGVNFSTKLMITMASNDLDAPIPIEEKYQFYLEQMMLENKKVAALVDETTKQLDHAEKRCGMFEQQQQQHVTNASSPLNLSYIHSIETNNIEAVSKNATEKEKQRSTCFSCPWEKKTCTLYFDDLYDFNKKRINTDIGADTVRLTCPCGHLIRIHQRDPNSLETRLPSFATPSVTQLLYEELVPPVIQNFIWSFRKNKLNIVHQTDTANKED
ncbi:unnamed protein product [Rotaria magnacalcarata]